MPPVDLVHAIDFYHDMLTSGKIRVKEKSATIIKLRKKKG
jgi:hypothetical protein